MNNVISKNEKISSHYDATYVEELEAKVVSSHGVWDIVCKQEHCADEQKDGTLIKNVDSVSNPGHHRHVRYEKAHDKDVCGLKDHNL